MSQGLGALCDDFSISCRLSLKLEISSDREAVLHFFERVRREFPAVRRFRRREDFLALEEEASEHDAPRRWLRLELGSLRFGCTCARDVDEVRRFGEFIVAQAPYHLTLSDLVYDHLEVSYGFDLRYRGNHDQLVAETLSGNHAFNDFVFGEHVQHVIDVQSCFGVALTPTCDLQAYIEVKSRTTTYEVRNATFDGGPISVLLAVRKYWGLDGQPDLTSVLRNLFDVADNLASDKVVPQVVNPLAQAIASRS